MDEIIRSIDGVFLRVQNISTGFVNFIFNLPFTVGHYYQRKYGEPTLEDTIVEKIGGGPHGYGDPADTSMREVEYYLTPRMIWKKIRYEKCAPAIEQFYSCIQNVQIGEEHTCHKKEKEMVDCKRYYYSPDHIDDVEKECISEYIKLRSEFRKTGSEEDLWNIKMLMLDPSADRLHKLKLENKKYESENDAARNTPETAAKSPSP